jgi:urease accessory protein
MATDPSAVADGTLLQLMWLASPALPVGAFSYSEALEAAVDQGLLVDEAGAAGWLRDQLLLSQARADLAAAGAAHAAWLAHDLARAAALNDWVRTTREGAELRLQAEQTGRSLADWLRQRDAGAQRPDPRVAALLALSPAPTWPVAFALAACRTGADARQALLAMAFGWAENMVQAAVKAVPLGQSAGQRVLGRLAEAIPAAVDAALATGEAERQAHTPMLAVLSARHEMQYSRLFRS